MPAPGAGRQKGHTTLSDLLADDVRDYFLREGVPESSPSQQQQTTPTKKDKNRNRRSPRKGGSNNNNNGNGNKRHSKRSANNNRSAPGPSPSPTASSSSPSPSSSNSGSLRAGWANGTPTSASSKSSSKSFSPAAKLGRGHDNKDDGQRYQQQSLQHQQQHQHQKQRPQQSSSHDQRQFRGQPTAERHGIHPTNPYQNNPQPHLQAHQRHGSSGSGSFHSKGSIHSKGSQSSRGKHVHSAADAEFLKRYAEEKERTNSRMMSAARPGSRGMMGDNGKAMNDSIAAYHTFIKSPRPPTVAGSHRPGLPSIGNDDWEEDDRLEQKDKRKLERKEARKMTKERHRRMRTNSEGGDSIRSGAISVGTLGTARGSVVYHSSHHNQDAPSIGTRDCVVNHREDSASVVPRPIDSLTRMSSHEGSVMSIGSVGITPGSERYESGSSTLCYSTGSSHQLHQLHNHQQLQRQFPPELPFHNRADSGGTFVRRGSSNSNGSGKQLQLQPEPYLQQKTTNNGHHHSNSKSSSRGVDSQGNEKKTRHVRPLSYLSASSDSGKESGEFLPRDQDPLLPNYHSGDNHRIQEDSSSTTSSSALFGLRASPHSSTSGKTPRAHPLQGNLSRFSSRSSSDLNSALLGSAIIESVQSGDSVGVSPVKRSGSGMGPGLGGYQQQQQQERRYDDGEDSSDGSYDSDASSGSSSDSYYGDSSSNDSQSTSEHQQQQRMMDPRQRQPPLRYQQQQQPPQQRDSPSKGVRWEPLKFDDNSRFDYRDGDIEGGMPSNERDRLSGGRRNNTNSNNTYSTMQTTGKPKYKTRAKKNRGYNRNSSPANKHRLGGPGCVPLRLDDAIEVLLEKMKRMFVMMELFISNMPSLVGSLALAWCSLGVDWFKWYEETFDACHPTHYHNKACVFTEFPGCFACETTRDGYQVALHIHYLCSTIAFILSSFLVGKIIIAFPVVRDELANPTTAAPLGLLCMAFEKVFAGNFGYVGTGVTFVATALHTAVAGWFIFISVVYKTLPEPSWFSNTTGIGLAAAKLYLYWTGGGYFLSGLSVLAFSMFYVVSLYRIHTNEKISAPVCWVQLSGPAVVLYGFTIFSQPGSDEADFELLIQENKDHFYQIHRTFYMPVVHLLFGFCMVSMASSLYLLRSKWKSFREKEFSPAHVSFGAPLVSHANAMQAYRSSLNKFSSTPPGTTFKVWLYRYWTLSLICGTVLVLVLTWKFFVYLPSWCQIDVDDDEMPPEPDETIVTRLLQKGEAGDSMKQNFVSAAVLQANESGALVRVLQDGKMKYVRSRRMPSMGFDPIMNVSELMSERERLLQHVTYAANPSRDRGGMSSFDDILMDTFHEPNRLRASSGRQRLNFMSFDASTAMRGYH